MSPQQGWCFPNSQIPLSAEHSQRGPGRERPCQGPRQTEIHVHGCRLQVQQCSAVPCRAVLPLRCWPSAVSGLQRLWGWAAGGGAPRELSLGQWGCPSSRHISILLTWPLTHPHGHWPPNWKPRTKAAPLCGQSSRDCQCFFNLSIAVVLCW